MARRSPGRVRRSARAAIDAAATNRTMRARGRIATLRPAGVPGEPPGSAALCRCGPACAGRAPALLHASPESWVSQPASGLGHVPPSGLFRESHEHVHAAAAPFCQPSPGLGEVLIGILPKSIPEWGRQALTADACLGTVKKNNGPVAPSVVTESVSEEDAVAQQGEAGASVHLPRDPLGPGVDALGAPLRCGRVSAELAAWRSRSRPRVKEWRWGRSTGARR